MFTVTVELVLPVESFPDDAFPEVVVVVFVVAELVEAA